MKMYRCPYCKHEFEEPRYIHTTYENYYGVSGLFGNSTSLTIQVCPYCKEEDFEEFDDEEEEEEDE